jgi:hypothetical protein
VFGWKFQDLPQMGYTMWEAPSGPSGGLMAPKPEQPGTGQPLNYIYVKSIDETVPRIESSGGKVVVQKTAIPGMGWFAFFQYPESMIWGLYEAAAKPAAGRASKKAARKPLKKTSKKRR